jgi:hypothetical protein
MELQPPLLPQLFPPHRLTLRKHLPLQPTRQERPQTLASLMECPPSPATWWISSPATERSHSSRTSTRQVACGTCRTSASHACDCLVASHNNRKLAHRAKKLDGNPPAPASIRARARYAEYCARKGALSKANQAMTSDLTPSAAPTNINELRAKNPEPTHPARDPTTQPASLIWPQKADTGAWWEEEEGQEYI